MKKQKDIKTFSIIMVLLLTLMVSSFMAILWNLNFYPRIKNSIILAITKKPEAYTELYFENHNNLPTIANEDINSFKFTIHNFEYSEMNYKYVIYKISNQDTSLLSSGLIKLAHNEYKTLENNFILTPDSGKTKIEVLLVDKNQKISFWTEQK